MSCDTCGGNCACVLVVDDYTDSRDVICAMLQTHGYGAMGAGTGGEAIEIIDERCSVRKACPDLVIIDVDLPDIKGGTLARWIRQVYPQIPLIFLTAYGRPPAIEELAENLKAPLLAKPIEPSALLSAVTHELTNYRQRRVVGMPLSIPPVMRERIEEVQRERAKGHSGDLP